MNGALMRPPIRILGIDPGLRRTGWGVIDVAGNRLSFVACGSVSTDDKAALAARLVAIHDGLSLIIDQFGPAEAAVEATFVNKDATATLKLGQARGIALLDSGSRGSRGCRIRAQPGEENHRRRRPQRQDADPHDDRRAVAQGRSAIRRRSGRARHRGMPRASPRHVGVAPARGRRLVPKIVEIRVAVAPSGERRGDHVRRDARVGGAVATIAERGPAVRQPWNLPDRGQTGCTRAK